MQTQTYPGFLGVGAPVRVLHGDCVCVCDIKYIYSAVSSPSELRQLLAFHAFESSALILPPTSGDPAPQCEVLPALQRVCRLEEEIRELWKEVRVEMG